MARKSKYDPDTFPLLAGQYAREGLNDEQISEKLGVSTTSYYEYQNEYPEFLQAIKEGKKPADIQVENALFKSAIGYEYVERHVEYIQIKNPNIPESEELGEEPVDPDDAPEFIKVMKVKEVTKEFQPNVTACIFWSVNRQPKRWKNIQQIEHSGSIATITDLVKAAKLEDETEEPGANADG